MHLSFSMRDLSLQRMDSLALPHSLSCSQACGVCSPPGTEPTSLHRKVAAYPLDPQGSPCNTCYSLVAVCGLLTAVVSLVVELGL